MTVDEVRSVIGENYLDKYLVYRANFPDEEFIIEDVEIIDGSDDAPGVHASILNGNKRNCFFYVENMIYMVRLIDFDIGVLE
jgi:hypothetical protein